MTGSLNRVILVGQLASDPETRSLGSSTITTLRLVTTEGWKDKTTGQWKDRREYHKVAIFNEFAQKTATRLKEGSKCLVEGELKTRKWTDKEGKDVWTTEVVIQQFGGKLVPLDDRPFNGKNTATATPAPRRELDDEIPF